MLQDTDPFSSQLQHAALFSPEPRSYIARYAGDPDRAVDAITDELVARLGRPATGTVKPRPAV